MKAIVSLLFFLCLCSGIGGIAGITRYSYSSTSGVDVSYATTPQRVAMLVVFAASGSAAFGCIRRRKFGWWLVAGGTAAIIALGFVAAFMSLFTADSISDRVMATVQNLAVSVLLLAFLWRIWLPKRPEFRIQPPDLAEQ
jgi:uncharacterized membrane protein